MADGTREYSLLGRDGEQAVISGLAGARWYQTDIPRKQLAELMQRRDGPAIRDTVILFAAMIGLAAAAAVLWPSWLALPCLLPMAFLWIGDGLRWHNAGTRRHSSHVG